MKGLSLGFQPQVKYKLRTRPERAAEKVLGPEKPNVTLGLAACRPFRAGHCVNAFLGLKPQAESFHPFGIKTTRYRCAGLSLIELLVVVAIIAAISALITTSVLSALKQQNQRICQNNMLTIEAAKDEYIRDHPGATFIDKTAFQQYFRFGIPTCPDQPTVAYNNLYELTQQVNCSIHGNLPVSPSPTP